MPRGARHSLVDGKQSSTKQLLTEDGQHCGELESPVEIRFFEDASREPYAKSSGEDYKRRHTTSKALGLNVADLSRLELPMLNGCRRFS